MGGAGAAKLAAPAALTAAIAVAATAWAATGDLTSAGCVEDNDDGPDACTASLAADGLEQAREVLVSPTGSDVYAVSFDDKAAVPLRRNASTGAISYVEACIADSSSVEACGSANGMDGAGSIAISPDGEHVYVGSETDGAVAILDRDPGTGAISFDTCIEDDEAPAVGCGGTAAGLEGVRSLAVSADGEFLYAAGGSDHAVQILDRDTNNGSLADADCVEDASLGSSGCATSVEGLAFARSATLSPDGASLYATSEVDDAVVRFSRNSGSGALTGQGCFSDNGGGGEVTCTQTDGLNTPYGAAVSPDGKSLYVVANSDDSVKRFDRNTASGALTPQACVDDAGAGACAQSMTGLDAPTRVVVSPDGLSVYAAANGSDSIAALSRNPSTGALTPLGCAGDNDTGPPACSVKADGLDAVWGIAISPDGSSLYTGSRIDNAVAHLRRELLAAPVPGKSVVVRPVSGTVTVKLPGASSFTPLSGQATIPVGSEVDVSKGVVNLSSQATGGALQSADFKFGRFKVTQSAKKGAFTELKITGPLGCGKKKGKGRSAGSSGGPTASASKRRGRRLWGSGSGRFRTSGRKGSGAARGTIWEVTDRCDNKTRIKSHKGKVTVRDFVRKRTLVIKTGQGYLAPGPKKRKRR